MNLAHLRHLIALAEHQSFRKAAAALFITQPALSRSIQALERELGVRLVDRVGRRNILTAYGQQVVGRARKILFEASEIRRGAALTTGGEVGTLRLGLGPTPAAILATPFLIHMASRHPGIQVKLARGSIELLCQALRNETVDVIAVDRRALPATEDLALETLPPLRAGFVCRAGHPLLALPRVDLALLRGYPVASTPLSEEVARDLMAELGQDAHPSRLVTLNSEDIGGLVEVVEKTDAIFLGVFAVAQKQLDGGRLVELRLQPHFERIGSYALATLAGRSESPAQALFRAFAHEHFHA